MADTANLDITIVRPSPEQIQALKLEDWSPWECPPKTFAWEYFSTETAYVIEGKVKVATPSGEVEIKAGDLVTFPKGLKCHWQVIEKIKKVYKFS